MKRIDLISVCLFFVSGFIAGFIINEGIKLREVGYSPIELSKEEHNFREELMQPLIPMDIKLRILSDEDFNRESIKYFGQKMGAFTQIGSNDRECKITIPAGMGNIHYIPEEHFSTYFDKGNITLAHELLHCIKGHWHQ